MSGAMNAVDAAAEDPQGSKFERYGKHLIKDLKHLNSQPQNEQCPFHSYQIEAVLKTRRLVMQDDDNHENMETTTESVAKPILIVAPTGAGKSGIIVMLPYVLESSKVLVLTPSKVISEQLSVEFGPSTHQKCFLEKTGYKTDLKKLENFLETVTLIKTAADVTSPERLGKLVIVNAQKFGGQAKTSLVHKNEEIVKDTRKFFALFDTLIVDEAHHYPAKTWTTIVNEFSKQGGGSVKRIIFLTATPYRTDSFGDKEYIWNLIDGGKERIALEITPQEVEGKTTRPCKFKESVEKMTHDTLARDLNRILREHYQREDRFVPQAMILVQTKDEATKIANDLNSILNNSSFAVAILGSSNKRKSLEKSPLEKFSAGEYTVAVTCGVALEGYDNSRVTLCVILRKIVTGRILFTQFVGRCKRMQRNLEGENLDRTVATVFSYKQYKQREMWNELDRLAETDPVEIDDDEEDYDEFGEVVHANVVSSTL